MGGSARFTSMTVHDPYAGCDKDCGHDLVRGILVDDLKHDGPYPESSLLIGAQWLAAQVAAAADRQTGRLQT